MQKAVRLARHTFGLKSCLLIWGRSPGAARAASLASKVMATAVIGLLLFVLVAPHFGFVFLTITGDSMAPAMPAGSIAMVEPVDSSGIRTGDVLAYRGKRRESPIVTHRVTEVVIDQGLPSFATAGDRNRHADSNSVTADMIVGRVRFHVPLLGFVFTFVRQPLGYGLLVGLPVLVLAVVTVRRLVPESGLRTRRRPLLAAAVGELSIESYDRPTAEEADPKRVMIQRREPEPTGDEKLAQTGHELPVLDPTVEPASNVGVNIAGWVEESLDRVNGLIARLAVQAISEMDEIIEAGFSEQQTGPADGRSHRPRKPVARTVR